VIDVGYRAVHEMTVQAKAIINGYYNSAPKYSYFNGCSLGGRQGITEAQRYPADYDASSRAQSHGAAWIGTSASS
jgi:feruloyl esterase